MIFGKIFIFKKICHGFPIVNASHAHSTTHKLILNMYIHHINQIKHQFKHINMFSTHALTFLIIILHLYAP